MTEQRDTLFRYMALLRLIPREPSYRSTTTLQQFLEEAGFKVGARTLQRDLEKLSQHFPIVCDDSAKPYRWGFDCDFRSNLPAMEVPAALTWVLAEQYLKGLLPKVAVDQLQTQFDLARQFLDGHKNNGFSHWTKQVMAIPPGKALMPAAVEASIWQGVTDAILMGRAIEVCYLSKQKGSLHEYVLHPLGLVIRHNVTYLLALVNDYDDVRQFVLHRIQTLAVLDEVVYRSLPDFSVEHYVASGAFGLPLDSKPIELQARVTKEVAWMLSETPVSEVQSLSEPDENGWCVLKAQVPNDQQTQWWLQSFGANIEVLAPQIWRDAILEQARRIVARC